MPAGTATPSGSPEPTSTPTSSAKHTPSTTVGLNTISPSDEPSVVETLGSIPDDTQEPSEAEEVGSKQNPTDKPLTKDRRLGAFILIIVFLLGLATILWLNRGKLRKYRS